MQKKQNYWNFMSKVKYYYDHDTLSYREIKVTNKNRISGVLLFLLASFFFGITSLLILLNSDIINTPSEVAQKRSIENFKLQFDILNKKLGQLEKVIANIENRDNNLYRVYFEASPIPEEQRRAGFGGINRYKDLEGYDNSDLIINTTKRLDILTKQTVVQSRSLEEIESLAKNKASLIEAIPTIQPIKNKDLTRVASGYGYRIDPFTKIRRFHYGMDFTAKRGTPIYATGNGIVKRADNRSSGYGKHIRIDHGFGYVSLYAHLSKYKVRRGQKVKRGDIIGYVGNSGRSVGPHLHYEILKDNKKINPLNFYYGNLSAQEYEALLTQSNQENQSMDWDMHVNLPKKRYYSIGEVAKAFQVKPSLLRFWEKEFKEIQPKKKESGTRKYTPDNLKQIQYIYHLIKEKGMTLAGAKKQLELKNSGTPKQELLSKLEKIKSTLENIKENL